MSRPSLMPRAGLRAAVLLLPLLVAAGCARLDEFPPHDCTAEYEAFLKDYNAQVIKEAKANLLELEPTEKALAADPSKAAEWEELRRDLTKLRRRLDHPEFFTFATTAEVPAELVWENGQSEPEVGDNAAKKGGKLTDFMLAFPPTLRVIGANSNNSFRSEHWDYIEIGLTGLHPDTGAVIPGLAKEWAVSEDRRTVYYRLDPDATYSDGVPVVADDFIFQFYLQLSKYPTNPFGNEYYATQFENITRYDERTLSITVADARPLTPYFTSVPAAPRHFYREFGPDFEQRFDWRSRPSTGAFIIHEEDVKKGYSITLSRVPDWWAKDKKFYKNRWNVDRIEMRVIREQEKALEMFKVGHLDTFILNLPEYWYEKTDVDPVFNGYIEKAKFYNQYPRVNRGLYINTSKPLLDNLDVRIGLAYATNFDKVIEFDLRNDYSRMRTFADGYGDLSHPALKAREFSPQKAREAFAKAGFTSTGKDGVLVNAAKQRLSFEITYPKSATSDKIMQRLKEEALKVGLEYKLDGVDGTSYFKKATLKQHDITLSGFGLDPPFMDYFQFFHSKDAYEPDGKTPKTNTNNLFCYANPEMDKWATIQRNATTIEEMREASHKCEEFIHRDAIFIPGYVQDYYRIGYWRWVRFPANTFNVKIAYDAMEAGVQWVDEDLKKETLAAMRSGKTYPEVLKVYDQYRVKSGSPEEEKQP